jgi:septal ring factor EnvC (AmiA/AmiB activator)
MSEEAARALLSLSQSIAEGETNRTKIVEQMASLNGTLAALNEATADDRRIREQLAQLNANLQQLADTMRTDRQHQTEILTSELRGLSASVAALIGNASIAKRGK